jgi:hypothetical protein
LGQDSDGNKRYARLITFKELNDAEPIAAVARLSGRDHSCRGVFGEKSKKCPLALASDLKNYTKVTVPTTATEGTAGLDNVTLQKLKHSSSVATQPSL